MHLDERLLLAVYNPRPAPSSCNPPMRWHVRLDAPATDGLAWVREMLGSFDTRRVEWLRINHGSARYRGVYGRCWLPTAERPTFRLSCQLPGPFPATITTRKRPLYRQPDGSFPRVPSGCWTGKWLYDPRTGREWMRLRGTTHLRDLDEALVWIVNHEAFHFLRATRQIPGRNTEIEADAYADAALEAFRAERVVGGVARVVRL